MKTRSSKVLRQFSETVRRLKKSPSGIFNNICRAATCFHSASSRIREVADFLDAGEAVLEMSTNRLSGQLADAPWLRLQHGQRHPVGRASLRVGGVEVK